MRISDWSSDVCSSDLHAGVGRLLIAEIADHQRRSGGPHLADLALVQLRAVLVADFHDHVPRGLAAVDDGANTLRAALGRVAAGRSDERRVGAECVRPCRYRWSEST